MNAVNYFRLFLKTVSSLRLTMALLLFSMALVFFSTLEQVHLGVHAVQERYFAQWLILMPWPASIDAYDWVKAIRIPLLGGYALGALFLMNLVVAFPKVFQWRLKKLGIGCIHLGLIMLIVSGFLGAYFQEETQMWIEKGQIAYYSESTYDNEFVLVDITDKAHDTVYSIPSENLYKGQLIEQKDWPLSVRILDYYPNAAIGRLEDSSTLGVSPFKATQGSGEKMGLVVFPRPLTYKEDERNAATAYVEILSNTGESLGIWLVSNILDDRFPRQILTHEGREYSLALRFKRSYWPIGFELVDFIHTVYPGTEIPQNFMSHLLLHEGTRVPRPVTIRMNEPLRTHGGTFYQASFNPNHQATLLQVVKNPGWLVPYLGVFLIGFGLLFHFGYSLWVFLNRHTHQKA